VLLNRISKYLAMIAVLGPMPAAWTQARPMAPQQLPTGMSITPTAARGTILLPLNPDLPEMPQYTADHPISTALSPDGTTLLVLTSGFNKVADIKAKHVPALSNEYVFIYDVRRNPPVKQQVITVPNTYVGIAWAPDGHSFYVSGGMNDNVHVFYQNVESKSGREWAESLPAIALGHKFGLGIGSVEEGDEHENKPVAAGLAVSANSKKLLIANSANDSVSLIDTNSKQVMAELDLRPGKNDPAQKGVPGGEYPYAVAFNGNDKAYVSSLRDREIVVLDMHGTPAISARIKTHGQPGKMILNKAQTLLFAVADNSDTVIIIDTAKGRIAAEIKTTAPSAMLAGKKNFKGSIPTSLALSPDEKTLYVTNAGTNSLAVIRLEKDPDDSTVVGLIPTAWYPTSVSAAHDGKLLYVTYAKSIPGPNPKACRNDLATSGDKPCALSQQYVLQMEKGGLAVIPRPLPQELAALTMQVAHNNHLAAPNSIPNNRAADEKLFSFLRTKIHHVIYIVKENRSYDQVLGDLEKGNGDPSLTLFPDPMSPNHHELARRFVTLDNFYDSGEVSGNGWNWSTAARATDFTERTIPMNYAQRGLTYDVEGVNRGINVGAASPQDRYRFNVTDPDDQLPGTADVAAPDGPDDESGAGYLWDSALRGKISLRNYGFFVDLAHYSSASEGGPAIPLLHAPNESSTRVAFPTKRALQDVTDPYYRGFDMRFADFWRFKEWEREFDDYVKNDNLPALELVRLPRDHFGNFSGAADGVNTVEAQMADNDYAVGMLAEKIATSKYARDTLIFVLEDDAQNGPDHVDAHRSIALVFGAYVKKGAVVSRHYTTVSVLRTIEEVLGLGALGINDAYQFPMTDVFTISDSSWNFKARVPAILRSTELPLPPASDAQDHATSSRFLQPLHLSSFWAEQTKNFDFSEEDKLDSQAFNQILWKGLKGESAEYPTERSGKNLRRHRAAILNRANQH
jgi:DNA-binding beta-propeller fold protein YncE